MLSGKNKNIQLFLKIVAVLFTSLGRIKRLFREVQTTSMRSVFCQILIKDRDSFLLNAVQIMNYFFKMESLGKKKQKTYIFIFSHVEVPPNFS